MRGNLFKEYVDLANSGRASDVVITPENAHLVKTALIENPFTLKREGQDKINCSAFRILPPYKMPMFSNQSKAQAFFEEIKGSRQVNPDDLELSWWFIEEIDKEYQVQVLAACDDDE